MKTETEDQQLINYFNHHITSPLIQLAYAASN